MTHGAEDYSDSLELHRNSTPPLVGLDAITSLSYLVLLGFTWVWVQLTALVSLLTNPLPCPFVFLGDPRLLLRWQRKSERNGEGLEAFG